MPSSSKHSNSKEVDLVIFPVRAGVTLTPPLKIVGNTKTRKILVTDSKGVSDIVHEFLEDNVWDAHDMGIKLFAELRGASIRIFYRE